ncbi:hypothetical protein P692DRAFT_20104508 [Suillus brevipes Sb2]|nr:hypothetical protein P692DRAFT_20104508 [Suillus brevipes Sb2]
MVTTIMMSASVLQSVLALIVQRSGKRGNSTVPMMFKRPRQSNVKETRNPNGPFALANSRLGGWRRVYILKIVPWQSGLTLR